MNIKRYIKNIENKKNQNNNLDKINALKKVINFNFYETDSDNEKLINVHYEDNRKKQEKAINGMNRSEKMLISISPVKSEKKEK